MHSPSGERSFGPTLSYAGISLTSDFQAVAARYPHSTPQREYISLAPKTCTIPSRPSRSGHRTYSTGTDSVLRPEGLVETPSTPAARLSKRE